MKKLVAVCVSFVMILTLSSCGETKNAEQTPSPDTMATVQPTDAGSPAQETIENQESSMTGVLVGATTNTITIKAEDGVAYTYDKNGADVTGLKDGLIVGHKLVITYQGAATKKGTIPVKAITISDAA